MQNEIRNSNTPKPFTYFMAQAEEAAAEIGAERETQCLHGIFFNCILNSSGV